MYIKVRERFAQKQRELIAIRELSRITALEYFGQQQSPKAFGSGKDRREDILLQYLADFFECLFYNLRLRKERSPEIHSVLLSAEP